MTEIEAFPYQFEGNQREILLFLHDLLSRQLELTGKIRYKIPFYYRRSWICYLNPTRDQKVEFAFTRGNELSNAQGLLESKDRKQVYSLTFEKLSDIPPTSLLEIIQEAILLDEVKPYASKRQQKK